MLAVFFGFYTIILILLPDRSAVRRTIAMDAHRRKQGFILNAYIGPSEPRGERWFGGYRHEFRQRLAGLQRYQDRQRRLHEAAAHTRPALDRKDEIGAQVRANAADPRQYLIGAELAEPL